MSLTRFLAAIFVSAGPLFGQPFHIRGTVTDSTTRQPIPGALVSTAGGLSTRTTASGNFDLPVPAVGTRSLTVTAEKHFSEVMNYTVMVTGETEPAPVHMEMYLPGIITGRLVDAETRQPIVGLRFSAARFVYKLGRKVTEAAAGSPVMFNPGQTPSGQINLSLQRASPGKSVVREDQPGVFRFEQLRPGTYSLSVSPEFPEYITNSTPSEFPAKPADRGYRRQKWPNEEAGFVLRPGAVLELGDILLAREPLFKVTGSLTGCPVGDNFSRGLSFTVGSFGGVNFTPVACGEAFSAGNLAPGDYAFALTIEGLGSMPAGRVTVSNRDMEVSPAYSVPLKVDGTLIAPERFAITSQLSVGLAQPSQSTAGPITLSSINANKTFQLQVPPSETREFIPPLVSSPYYVAEVLYNGAPLRDGMLEVNPSSAVHDLKVRIADDGARLTGKVRRSDQAATDTSVALLPYPDRVKNGFPMFYLSHAKDGQFEFPVLPPGTYHAIAVERQAWDTELQKPGVLRDLAFSGTQVVLAPKAAGELTLEVRWIQLNQ